MFGEQSYEVFRNTGNANNQFLRIEGTYHDIGLEAPDSLASDGANIFWLGANASGFGPDFFDWRPTSPGRIGYYNLSNGSLVPFSFQQADDVSSPNRLIGVSVSPPPTTSTVIHKNGSWCWDANIQPSSNDPWCDDDYYDSDEDGISDWEENFGFWGFQSDPFDVDSDNDTVNDLDEILNGTDPLEPCDNNRDTDDKYSH